MTKKNTKNQLEIKNFLKDVNLLCALPTSKNYEKLLLPEYPFDNQLLHISGLYRESRKLYLSMGGSFSQRVSSRIRALSAQDLFKNEIDFTPTFSELMWFKDHSHEVGDPLGEIDSLARFSEISLFHEQNHRVAWGLLPPAPQEERDLCRYLNFAESLVVTLDLALADQIGKKLSTVFERMQVIYRTGGHDKWIQEPKEIYRKYLLSLMCSTYYILEHVNPEDVLTAVNYVIPGQKKMNRQAVNRSLDISELFTRVTNPLWQERYWLHARTQLTAMHAAREEHPLYLPEDPLDFNEEFIIAGRVFDYFGL